MDNRHIYLTSYFRDTPAYHKLLKENEILHMDLSVDENLQRQYAHTLQSLARGDDIDTSGLKFKTFLFHYDDDVAVKFRAQAQQIEDDHERYVRDWATQNLLTKKKEVLVNLLALKKKKQEAFELRLTNEAFFNFQLSKKKEKEYKETTEQYFSAELEMLAIDERLVELELVKLENEKRQKEKDLEIQKRQLSEANSELQTFGRELAEINETLPRLAREKDALRVKCDNVEKVKEWLNKYSTTDDLKRAFEKQKSTKRQEEKLHALKSFLNRSNLRDLFMESQYTKSVKEGIEFYVKKKEEINSEISYLEKIKEIISTQSIDSLAGWAVKEQNPLNQLQESVLFHFATLPTKYDAKENYIPSPKEFIAALQTVHETDGTFIINLGGLFYHIAKRPDYIFTDPAQLKSKIDKIGRNFQKRIQELRKEQQDIAKLDTLFTDFNFSEEHLLALRNEREIQAYESELTLNLTDDQFVETLKDHEEDLKQKPEQRANAEYQEKLALYEEKLGRKNRSNEIISNQSAIKLQSTTKIYELDGEINDKITRITHLRNTEVKALEGKLIIWRSNMQNTYEAKDELYGQYKQKHKNSRDEQELRKAHTELVRKSSPLAALIPQLTASLPILKTNFENRKNDYERYFKKPFNENELVPLIDEGKLQEFKSSELSSNSIYEEKYKAVFGEFNEELKDSPKVKEHNFDLNALILELIPHEIISNKENPEESLSIDIESKLSELHQKIKELSKEEATKIKNTVREIRTIVNRQTTFLDQIKALLQDFTLANHRKVLLQWNYSPEFDIKWIDALQKDINELNFEDNLFGERTKLNAHELLERTFKKYCPAKLDAKAHEILNPFNYYDVSAIIVDHNDLPSPGSNGQNYGMLALLCIAKLSIVEGKTKNAFQKIEPGIRILPIDEVAGLGENYDMLYEIAQRLDYQIFTMTISANDLEFEEGKQIYYEFIPNSKKELADYNEGVQACFSKDNLIHDIETYFKESVYSLENVK